MFHDKFSKSSDFYYLEPGPYPSITDIIETKDTLFQERHNHYENVITVELFRRTHKVEIYVANEGSGLALFFTDLGQFSGSTVGNKLGVILRGKRPHNQKFA